VQIKQQKLGTNHLFPTQKPVRHELSSPDGCSTFTLKHSKIGYNTW